MQQKTLTKIRTPARGAKNRADLVGKRRGLLVVLEYVGSIKKYAVWKCVCDCGTITLKSTTLLQRVKHPSCGCTNPNINPNGTFKKKHSLSIDPNLRLYYYLWKSMMRRCYHADDKGYKYYGARGIIVEPQWHNSSLFIKDLLETLGTRPEGSSLDRIDTNKGYIPGNLRWAPPGLQCYNRRTLKVGSNRYRGVTQLKGRYIARITFNRKIYNLGSFKSEKEAASAYNKKAMELYGDNAILNKV